MEETEVNNDTVHPQVRAHINSLVSALGGYSIDDDGGYKLGDDALEVLRDLKKWIRFYDEKTNRMDVARCLAEANIVSTDLLQILATWPPNDNTSKYKARIALACFEVMVPLTWPIEKDREAMTVNHHRHMPVLQLAQVGYKRAIINFDAAPILSTAVRVALPAMALPVGERSARDQGIIKLILFFLRNIAMITPPPGVKYEGDETQISRSALIDAFSYQDIFLTLLTIASNMGGDFRNEDVIVAEIIFHIVKRVDPGKLFVSEKKLDKIRADELAAAMSKEAAMLRSYNKKAPTRHSRFGTMIWVKRESGKVSTVSGQDALLDPATRLRKMDSTKSFKPPRRARKEDTESKDLGPPVSLDERARQQLQSFASEFLDSGFNPLFSHLRKSIDQEAPHVLHYHQSQFFYLVAWFLEAERMRRNAKKESSKQPTDADDVGSFNLVAEVLNQEMFITLNRALVRAYGDKDWRLLTTAMRCLTQILLTVQEMADSGNEEDEEIADNMLNRLFYEETTHDAIANIVRTYKDQGFEYLDASIELTHTFIRILEAYSKQNVDLQVRSRKRARRKRKAAKAAGGQGGDEDQAEMDDDSADDQRAAEATSQERKFDFKRFAIRFVPQGVVDTFVTFTKFYRDLDDSQLKRAHRYFYRVAFKMDMSVMLFRLDIIHLFYNMIKGPEPLDKNSSMYKDFEELVKFIFKKFVKKLEERPALFTEVLFSKTNSTAHFLEYGYEKQTISTNPRPAAELEFKRELERDQQVAVVVGVLLDRNQTDHLEWIKKELARIETERRAWESTAKAAEAEKSAAKTTADSGDAEATPPNTPPYSPIRPDNDARRKAMFKNPHLRLLMKLAGMERLTPTLDESPDSTWIIPGNIGADALQETVSLINKAEFNPPTFDDGQLAEDQLRRKSAPRSQRAAHDDHSDNFNDDDDDDGILFPAGGPTTRKRTAEDEPLPLAPSKKRRRRRRREEEEEDGDGDDERLAELARARRRRKQLEKARRIKSEMYVRPSDDETDEEGDREFFAREQARQAAKDASFGLSSKIGGGGDGFGEGEGSLWEMLMGVGEEEKEEDDDGAGGEIERKKRSKRRRRRRRRGEKKKADSGSGESDEDEDEDGDEQEEDEDGDSDNDSDSDSTSSSASSTPPPPKKKGPTRTRKPSQTKATGNSSDEDANANGRDKDGDVDMDSTQPTRQSRGRSGLGTGDEDEPMADGTFPALNNGMIGKQDVDDDEDEDMPVAPAARARPRARAGFIVESSDEE
ncbi:hypothetical protein VTK26DRAFT_1258 [Humicola hyalothermophila]